MTEQDIIENTARDNGHVPTCWLEVAGFREHIVDAYERGIADEQLPADAAIARSLIPAGTASLRDFSHLSAEIPEFLADQCVGCMECVTECPDSAIHATVVEPNTLEKQLAAVQDPTQRETFRRQFALTNKYFRQIEKQGQTGGLFGIFIDPTKCKGCGECVDVCGEHKALRMVEKGEEKLDWYKEAFRFRHHLPQTPARFLNEKSLADVMLADSSWLYSGGAGSCMGCGEATAIRMMLAATGFAYGPESVAIVSATGCNSVYGSTYPYNPYQVPWTASLFENGPAVAMGVRLRWDQIGWTDKKLWVLGGDGAMADIGFQSLSRMLLTGMNIKVLVLDTQAYSNTGGQASTAAFMAQDAKMAPFGTVHHGKAERRKELAEICLMHPETFVAQTTPALVNHFYKAVMGANEYPGPAVIYSYASCMPEHGIADDAATRQARLAVNSRAFPVFLYDPRKGPRIRDRLSLQGNPNQKEDWYMHPKTGEPVDFVSFARTEGRFAKHFDAEGKPSVELQAAQEERLANWHRLQELAGIG
jgi:pyruvate/2-oxoacid:ferredoxin oxidoreductase beta subunit/NAD-dependent dihydropyrimidine dehydrogenase PreA subunit